jgi:hypothetical protein
MDKQCVHCWLKSPCFVHKQCQNCWVKSLFFFLKQYRNCYVKLLLFCLHTMSCCWINVFWLCEALWLNRYFVGQTGLMSHCCTNLVLRINNSQSAGVSATTLTFLKLLLLIALCRIVVITSYRRCADCGFNKPVLSIKCVFAALKGWEVKV